MPSNWLGILVGVIIGKIVYYFCKAYKSHKRNGSEVTK